MSFFTGYEYKGNRSFTDNSEKAKRKREVANEKFKKMYGISDAVYEKNFPEKSTKS